MQKKQIDLFIFAGEISADELGANLMQQLKKIAPSLHIAGVGGENMRKENFDLVMETENFEVMGFIDVFLSLPKLVKHFFFIRKKILELRPKVVLFIDYPGLNLAMQKSLRKKQFKNKLIQYVCPSIWAWGKNRKKKMEKHLDLLLSILPFEKELFSKKSLPVHYVGHPLMKKRISISKKTEEKKFVGLLPGSREKEIKSNFPYQMKLALELLKKDPTLRFAISISHKKYEALIHEIFGNFIPEKKKKNFCFFLPKEKESFLQKMDLAIATSGTITLELALASVPTLVIYSIKKIDLFLAKYIFRVRLEYYCLVNIIAKNLVFEEFFGPNLILERLLTSARQLLYDPKRRKESHDACKRVQKLLGEKDSSYEVAKILTNYFPFSTAPKKTLLENF